MLIKIYLLFVIIAMAFLSLCTFKLLLITICYKMDNSKTTQSSRILKIPKFLTDIERNINIKIPSARRNSGGLFKRRQEYVDEILQVYREAFDSLLKNMKTYKPLLSKIKESYEAAISIRDRQIAHNEIIMKVAWNSHNENKQKKKVEEQFKDNEIIKHRLHRSEEEIDALTKKIKEVESEVQTLNLALSTERDARYALLFENNKLKNEVLEISKCEKGKDPVILSIALVQCRKRLSKAVKDLNTMFDEYADTIPRKDHELLESSHNILLKDYNMLSEKYQNLTEKYEELNKDHGNVREEIIELRERCSDLEELGTPRPEWDTCGDFISGGWGRWRDLSKGLTSKDKLHVILKELGPAALSKDLEFFQGLGVDPIVPAYLQYNGKVRNLRLSRRDISILINDIWTTKEVNDRESTMQNYLTKYFCERYQQSSVRAEWAYNLCSGCEQMLEDQQVKLFWGVLNGTHSQDIYYAHRDEWNMFKENIFKILGVKGSLVIDDIQKCIRNTFPLKSEVDTRNIIEVVKRQLKIKSNVTDVDVEKLFYQNEEGFDRIELAKELMRQRQIAQEKYIKEIILELDCKKNQRSKAISVEQLKRAFVLVDPHIDHIILESNIRWVFANKTSQLNDIHPISLKKVINRLSSGNIQRVGPRSKRKQTLQRC